MTQPKAATGSEISKIPEPKLIVIVEPNFTVWTSTENDKINFIPKL